MVRSRKIAKKYGSLSTMMASFAGMLMAVPLVYAIGAPANIALAGQGQASQVSQSDFATFAYAFNQGYEARTASAASTSVTPGTCSEAAVSVGGDGSVSAAAVSGGSGAGAMTTSAPRATGGMGAAYAPTAKPAPMDSARWASMVNSYNSYAVYNSSSVTNTNSNNVVGSNNTTKTSVDVSDSKQVMIGVSNDPTATQLNLSNSLNKDSYNTTTTTNTSVINDSFNKPVAIDSGNTTTTTTNVAKDSFNTVDMTSNTNTSTDTTTNTMVDSNNTTTSTDTTNIDVTKTIDSNNTTSVDMTLPVKEQSDHQS